MRYALDGEVWAGRHGRADAATRDASLTIRRTFASVLHTATTQSGLLCLHQPKRASRSPRGFSLFLSAFSLRLSSFDALRSLSLRSLSTCLSAPPAHAFLHRAPGAAGLSNSPTVGTAAAFRLPTTPRDPPAPPPGPSALCAFKRHIVEFKLMNVAVPVTLPHMAARHFPAHAQHMRRLIPRRTSRRTR